MTAPREHRVTHAFVTLAASLAGGEDPLALLELLVEHCAELLDVDSAGLLLADRHDVLHVMAASTSQTRDLELFQVQRGEGPCKDCYHGGHPVLVADLARADGRWPSFAPAARAAGFASVHAVPMRFSGHRLGALGLFSGRPGALGEADLQLAQALADVSSITLVQDRAATDRDSLNAQLEGALQSRIVLEQAKGLLAQAGELDMGAAFAVLRTFSRDRNAKLSDVARALVARTLAASDVLADVRSRHGDGKDARADRRRG